MITPETLCEHKADLGQQVFKKSGKPFKSGLKVNTVKGLEEHLITHNLAYTFFEDDSVVEIRTCHLLSTLSEDEKKAYLDFKSKSLKI